MGAIDSAVRAFVALEIPAALRARIARLEGELGLRMPGVRWVRSDALHLTLRFFGDASPAQLDRVRGAIAKGAAACPATTARVRTLGVFSDHGRPRVLWLGLEVAAPVLALQASCEAAAVTAGFRAEERGFKPHLTLGRWRDRASLPALPEVDLGEMTLDTLTLFRSDLLPRGARHVPIATFELVGGD
jgi:RNA 2',3'-cyclic 3'-phosphodiesterase